MVFTRKHLDVSRFFLKEDFKSKRSGRKSGIPSQDRNQHGRYLSEQYQTLLAAADNQKKGRAVATITIEKLP